MARHILGRTHIGSIPDNPLQELPNFIEPGENFLSVAENSFPVFIPAVRMDKPWKLRKMLLEDFKRFLFEPPKYKNLVSSDKTVKINENAKEIDFSVNVVVDSKFKFTNAVIKLKDDYEIPVYNGSLSKNIYLGHTYSIVADTKNDIQLTLLAYGAVEKTVTIASGAYLAILLIDYRNDNTPIFAIPACCCEKPDKLSVEDCDIEITKSLNIEDCDINIIER